MSVRQTTMPHTQQSLSTVRLSAALWLFPVVFCWSHVGTGHTLVIFQCGCHEFLNDLSAKIYPFDMLLFRDVHFIDSIYGHTLRCKHTTGTTESTPKDFVSPFLTCCFRPCPMLWIITACVYLCMLGSMCVLPGNESSDSEFLSRTARQRSWHVSNPHPTCCANANYHHSKHTEWERKTRGYTVGQWVEIIECPGYKKCNYG